MIEKVSLAVSNSPIVISRNKHVTPVNSVNIEKNNEQKIYPNSSHLSGYVNFGACMYSDRYNEKVENIMSDLSAPAEEFLQEVVNVAKTFNNEEVNQLHLFYASLKKLIEYIEIINKDNGELPEYLHIYSDVTGAFERVLGKNLFSDKQACQIVLPILKEEINLYEKIFQANSSSKKVKNPVFAKDFINDLHSVIYANVSEDLEGADVNIDIDDIINSGIWGTKNYKLVVDYYNPFIYKVNDAIMLEDLSKKRPHIDVYDKYAENILMNLSTGTNMFVLHEDSDAPQYIVSSLINVLNSNKNFASLNKDNTDIYEINSKGSHAYLAKKVTNLKKDKSKNHIIIYNTIDMARNDESSTLQLPISLVKNMTSDNSNVKFIAISNKQIYDLYMTVSLSPNLDTHEFDVFGETSLPLLTVEQMKKAFRHEPLLLAGIKKDFSPNALDLITTATATQKGYYPNKAIKLINRISSTYPVKKEISLNDVKEYIKMRPDLFRNNGDSETISVVFDTGVKLKDMLGSKSTKAEITSIIRQIKQKLIGTKGFIIYPQDGYPGGGRKFSAKVIAGETKSPYLELNAMDFGTDVVSLLSGAGASPEKEIKSLFAMLKAQADSSQYKSAVLFIENFEFFTSEKYSTEYQQKAMAQLLREMDNAHKQGFNILVFGSVGSDDAIGEATMKSFKFVDKIEVETISSNEDARIEIINDFFKKNNIQMAANSKEEEKALLKNFADTTDYFSFIELMTLLGKVKNLLKETNHKFLNKSDFIEAYLQLISGRPASYNQTDFSKNIVASHECGHAINLAVMYKLAEKQNIPWFLPKKVNFITLDPRSNYGGAMYPKGSENHEVSYEKVFADIVCSYGGHSCEKIIYNMDGSWGITSDLEHVTKYAYNASAYMGQGKYYGKKSLAGAPFLSELAQKEIEKDVDVITANALMVSDLIINTYKDFVNEFTKKYAPKVGSGDCLVTSDEFEKLINDWKKSLSKEKKAEIEKMEDTILKIISSSKNGQIYEKDN